jgi:WD40 repeat protein
VRSLVFGIAQRGKSAIDSYNVFYWLTYTGAVDLDSVTDATTKASLVSQIENFGQTPVQLFRKQHPAKVAPPTTISSSPSAKQQQQQQQQPLRLAQHLESQPAPVTIFALPKRSFALLYPSGQFSICRASNNNIQFDCGSLQEQSIGGSSFACDGVSVYSCGYWDHKWRRHSLQSPQECLISSKDHLDIITCVVASEDGQLLVTGSRDTTLIVWRQTNNPNNNTTSDSATTTSMTQLARACGHEDTVTSVSFCTELHLFASGSSDGTVIVWFVRNAHHLCTIVVGEPVERVCLLPVGVVVTYSSCGIKLWSLQGALLSSLHVVLSSPVLDLFPDSIGGRVFVTIEQHCVCVWSTEGLIAKFVSPLAISAACISKDGEHLVVSHTKGLLSMFPFPKRAFYW